MGRPSQLIFIRHAESLHNKVKQGTTYFADEDARKTVKGIPDHKIPITEYGITQAQKTGLYLRERFGAPDYFYHSGYLRTIQTQNAILEAFSTADQAVIKIRMNQFIRERDPGYTYNMTIEEAEAAFPWLHDYWVTFGGFFSRPPGGESLSDVIQRVYMFLNTIFRDRTEMKVWTVLHGGTLKAARFILERWSYERGRRWPKGESPENCSITVYNFDPAEKRLVLQEYNTIAWS